MRCPGETVNLAARVVYVLPGTFQQFNRVDFRGEAVGLRIPPVLCLLLGTISNPRWKKFIGKHYKK